MSAENEKSARDASNVFPTLADGISAAPVPSDSEERLARLRTANTWLAVAFVLLCGVSAAAWIVEAREEAFWVWSIGAAMVFVFNLVLWRALLREDDKKARRIRERDQRYRQTLALLPEGVTILGEGWRIEWVNQRAIEHFDIRPKEVGRSFFEAVSDERLRHWLFERSFTHRYNMMTPAGLQLEVAVIAPDARHMMIVTHDVTERRRVEDIRRDFVANVSHELRTPLTVISGFLELESQTGGLAQEVVDHHRTLMLEQAKRMKSLLDDLLLLSSLENRDDQAEADAEVIAMPRLLEDVVREGRALSLDHHHISLDCEDISLVGQADEIRSAAMNLVSNAVRYTPEGGSIRVVWKRKGTGAALSVTDTGIGIEAKHIPRLTERFYRVDKGRSRGTGGTGLGLAIVKHVLRRNGGQLLIESTPGKGSTFSMVFPEERVFSEQI
ncbi:phosphate regulon sensor histidine kinase PhoR [Sutterella sp.]|uniref:phosphate regulon sensor histidine kinase PhoR n=1 Tax=Sutterella sp. TaxID=1981025 RepID=UPI0026E006BB|nr:phosphate regulon sensor histidine kinase PhoR [Sutterella sp.]MDO5530550.1 phosphate regulon sensor histidine kinase PhoR [Sutterella sp.]